MTATRIRMPPRILIGPISSPRKRKARITVVIGSKVERIDAFVGPTRLRPAKKVFTAMTVDPRAMARTLPQPASVWGSFNPSMRTRRPKTTLAERMTNVEVDKTPACFVNLLPARIYAE